MCEHFSLGHKSLQEFPFESKKKKTKISFNETQRSILSTVRPWNIYWQLLGSRRRWKTYSSRFWSQRKANILKCTSPNEKIQIWRAGVLFANWDFAHIFHTDAPFGCIIHSANKKQKKKEMNNCSMLKKRVLKKREASLSTEKENYNAQIEIYKHTRTHLRYGTIAREINQPNCLFLI